MADNVLQVRSAVADNGLRVRSAVAEEKGVDHALLDANLGLVKILVRRRARKCRWSTCVANASLTAPGWDLGGVDSRSRSSSGRSRSRGSTVGCRDADLAVGSRQLKVRYPHGGVDDLATGRCKHGDNR